MMKTENIILHDYLQVNGGAERLVFELLAGLDNFHLGVSGIYSNFNLSNFIDFLNTDINDLGNKYFFTPRILRALIVFNFLKFKSDTRNVIYSGIYSPLAIHNQIVGKKIIYVHTPPRFVFDRRDEYLNKINPIFRSLIRNIIDVYKKHYLSGLAKADVLVSNSFHISKLLKDFTSYSSKVIYPPINIPKQLSSNQGDYYVSVGRLEKNKRIDLIINLFKRNSDKKLIVLSGGSQLESLKIMANDSNNIKFTGWVDDEQLIHIISHSIATFYIPREEDFGMSAVESMAMGKPVIGVSEGGLKEIIKHEYNGYMLNNDFDINNLQNALEFMTPSKCLKMYENCQETANLFSKDRFINSFKEIII